MVSPDENPEFTAPTCLRRQRRRRPIFVVAAKLPKLIVNYAQFWVNGA